MTDSVLLHVSSSNKTTVRHPTGGRTLVLTNLEHHVQQVLRSAAVYSLQKYTSPPKQSGTIKDMVVMQEKGATDVQPGLNTRGVP